MSVTDDLVGATTPVAAAPRRPLGPSKLVKALTVGGLLFFILSFVRVITDANSLTSSLTTGVTLRLTIPIMLAGLAGLWAERAGVVNIGIEGMMILGTWFGGYAAWQWGPWYGLAFGIVGGMIGGLVHAIATVRFNVDHIISGVAINILAFGAMRYAAELVFSGHQGGGISQSPQQKYALPRLTVPGLASWLGSLEDHHWFLVSDAAGVLRGFVYNISAATIIALLMVPLTWFVLWRTRVGLRLRSSGEAPSAAESLGVRVVPIRYFALIVSGGLAGLGGAYLSIVLSSYYREGQTANRGFIGLATMIFGNWRPLGVLGGAGLFGFGDALQNVASDALPKLFLFLAIVSGLAAIWSFVKRKVVGGIVGLVFAGLFTWGFFAVHKVPEPLTKGVPYLLTLVVLATASRRLRPPAHAGRPWRKGEGH